MNGSNAEELVRSADLAMYQAKAEGKATFRVFSSALAERMEARRMLEADLRCAMVNGEFEVHYQPLFDPLSNSLTAAEALIRWRHPTRGLVPPAQFIPLAEETGLIAQNRRMGAPHRMSRGRELAKRYQGRGQPVSSSVP